MASDHKSTIDDIHSSKGLSIRLGTDNPLDHLPYTRKASFNSYTQQHEPVCLPNTRVDLLREIHSWADRQDDQCIFWLRGLAGTGKSTVARTVARSYHEEQRLAASFFFSRSSDDVSYAGNLVTSIAVDIANNVPVLRQYISDAVVERTDIASRSLRDQWHHLVLAPLSKLGESDYPLTAPLVLVVDALDECDSDIDIKIILQLLSETQSLTRDRLRVLLTSRPERRIRDGFRRIPHVELQDVVLQHISRSIVDHDIALLLQHDLQLTGRELNLTDGWPGAEIIAQLVQSAGGLFIWAATACRFIRDGKRFAPERLETILRNDGEVTTRPEKLLNQIYTTVLENSIQIFEHRIIEQEELLINIQYVLGSIVALYSPLSVQSLGQLLDVAEVIEPALEDLHAILDIPDDQSRPIRLHHPSLRNFLFGQNKCGDRFYVGEKIAHNKLAGCCIKLMSAPTSLRQNMCSLSEPSTLVSDIGEDILAISLSSELRYACQYWVEHLERSQQNVIDGDTVHVFLQQHLLHWVEAMSLIGETAKCVRSLAVLQVLVAPSASASSSLVHEAWQFVSQLKSEIPEAPLQVYALALGFVREKELLETASTVQGQDSVGGSHSETLVHEGNVLNYEKDDVSDGDDPLEISSVSSHITTAREKDAKAHVAYVLANDMELRALCSGVVDALGKAEFANEGRKLLKSFYCGLLMDAKTQLEKQSVSLLKSRKGRIRISSNIAEIISLPDVEHDETGRRAEEQIRMRKERLEMWAEDYTHTSHANEDSHERDAVQLRLVEKVNGQPEDLEYADSGTSPSGDSDEGFDLEGEAKENFVTKVTGMENFFRNSRSFEVLLDGFRELLLPQSLRDVLPATSVEISTKEDKSISNQMKSLVEDFTMLDWDWWPLTPRMRALKPNEKRLIWKCSCGTRLWKEISAEEADVVSVLLPGLETGSLSMPQCVKSSADLPLWRRLADDIKHSFSTLTGGQQGTSPTALSSTTTTTTTGVQATTTGRTTVNPQTPAQVPQSFPANQQLTSVSGSGSPPSLRWIIFGTQPYNKTAELEHIEIDDFTNDSRFFRSLRDHYRKHRGLLSRWFSIWRIGACDGVRFDRVASDLVFLENPELPTDFLEYIYNPKAPPKGNAENPLISRHKASMFMNCNDPCRWRFFHNCVPHLINRRVIDRVPRKKSKFAIRDDNSMEHQAWGITVRHEISVAYVVCYHVLILALPFAFWGWWQYNHPDDLQNAAVPITVVAGLLSLFWGANGILTEGRHSGSKTG
ncbi:hypothetical protein AA0113_g9767 [Alternaria arborescens]|uniref:Nephrocystin 3-like N-terminal domain-containing protein n=1 Tax=Alternaria arborescens TaxID=156630 RepID=A0A4Q4QYV5_9PLEO|nr:hypothetical protein AA0111_g10036 [Alternaria arborescens]RYN18368.1 hypothetical protein AA0112_g11616 [Alternaria arborescens]RYO20591.1 hypothetical protein AA0111_g10036 [Alternaria arborescens]RYO48999.1 hypothetical protein AA0113_g9767 [Alternaria arborescens]